MDKILRYACAVLFAAAVVFAILWRWEVAQNSVDAPDLVRLRVDSAITAGMIADRDSLLVELSDSVAILARDRSKRPPTSRRVANAQRSLTGIAVDSIMLLLDRPLPE